jgi:uncharacterized protein YcbX
MPTGTVSRLWRWPVKSMAGEEVRALRLDRTGVGGDRAHAVLHHHKGAWKPLTAREAPRMLAWTAAYPFNLDAGVDPASPPHAMVTAPDGRTWRWGDPRLGFALEDDLGRPVQLLRSPPGLPDVGDTVHLITTASLRALSEELGTDIDVRRFRANLLLDLDAPPFEELQWTGRELSFEDGVLLRVTGRCDRCAIPTRDPETREKWPELLKHLTARHGQDFGVRAEVRAGGRIGAGAQVRIETGEASASPGARR